MKLLKTLANQETAHLTRRLWVEHISHYKLYIMLGLLCMAVAAATTALLAAMLKPLFDDAFMPKDGVMVVYLAVIVFFVFIFKGLSSFGESVSMTYMGQRVIADLQKRLFSHFMRADLAYFHARSSGELVSRFTNDVNLMRNAVTTALTGMGKDSLSLVFLVGYMFYVDWLLASIAFFVFPVAVLPMVKIGRRMRKVSNNNQVEMGAFNILLSQVFQGMRVVKSYAMENYEQERSSTIIENLFQINFKGERTRAASHPIMECLGGVAIVGVILYGGWQFIEGNSTLGTFGSFITALLLAYEPMKRLANLNANLQEGLAAAKRIFEAIDLKPSLFDKSNAPQIEVKKGDIQLKDVDFVYPIGKKALSGINLSVPAGQRVALVGPSGSGKSTILNLIPRFYDVTTGSLTIDGIDVRDVTMSSLRENIALVSQEVTLFDDTVRSNIAYGRMGASDDEIMAAARDAAAHEFILELPHGYDTIVGEQGIRLSGGQRQRLSIARAMLKNAPILLLDEATSALDTESERQVQAALNRLMEGRTTVVVAHRLSTVVDSDMIYVIEDGQVSEQGKHEQLLGKDGTYARLVEMQFQTAHMPLAS